MKLNPWPDSGPKVLWKRPLGPGHSGILVDGGTLYTMYRQGDDEFVIALDAATGKTIWEFKYAAALLPGMNMVVGKRAGFESPYGPHATPLLAGGRIFATGITGKLHCLDKKTGRLIWEHGIIEELGGTSLTRGYSMSPIAFRETVIVTAGGAGHAVIAFQQSDGAIVWKRQDFRNSHSSPILIDVDGQTQLAALFDKTIAGLDPSNGDLLWTHPNDTNGDSTASTPVWGEDNLLFVSSAYEGGSRVVRLTREGGKTTATEVWAHKQMRLHHSNSLRLGQYIYGTSGDFGPAFLTALDVRTGEILWRNRAFTRANLVFAGGETVLLDEDGTLAIVRVSPQGLDVHCRFDLMQSKAWTAPALVVGKLYVRDRTSILAVDLVAR
jgi:outer membrane protein assembly factor BamB